MATRKRIFVGIKEGGKREVFRNATIPQQSEFGVLYLAVIGPFRTVRGAKLMAEYGNGNPHICCVQDAETIARQIAVASVIKKMGLS